MEVLIRRTAGPLFLLIVLTATAIAQSVTRVGQAALPATLTNQQFWNIIAEFSEASGQFPSDNFASNELQIGQVATDLISRGRTGGAYLGVGPEQNFTYIAATKPEIVFIVDIRRQAVMQHLMYKAIFEMSANRSEFIARLFSRPSQAQTFKDSSVRALWLAYISAQSDSALYRRNAAAIHEHLTKVRGLPLSTADSASIAQVYSVFYYYGPAISYGSRVGVTTVDQSTIRGTTFLSLTGISDTIGAARSFLASEENYRTVRELHMKNLFIPVVGNVGGPQALRKVGDYLRAHNTFVNAYYISNVEGYLFRPPTGGVPIWNEFYTSVGLMPLDSTSVFIRPNSIRVAGTKTLQLLQGLQQMPSDRVVYQVYEVVPPTLPAPPAGQEATVGSITGIMSDSASGSGLTNAIVQIVGLSFGANPVAGGQYTIPYVKPGTYTLRASRVGYAPVTISNVQVLAGAPTVLNFRLQAQSAVATGMVAGQVVGAGTILGNIGPSLCPMRGLIAAYKAGVMTSSNDAAACVQR